LRNSSLIKKTLDLDHHLSQRLSIVDTPGPIRNLAIFFAHSGDSWFWLIGLGFLWFIGNETWKIRSMITAISILILAALVLLIKFSIRRKRPDGKWGDIYRKTDPHSFPSGHAARAAMLAILAFGISPGIIGLLLAIWAPLVILARVFMGVHYLSDVIAGALLGIGAGLLALLIIRLFGVPF